MVQSATLIDLRPSQPPDPMAHFEMAPNGRLYDAELIAAAMDTGVLAVRRALGTIPAAEVPIGYIGYSAIGSQDPSNN